MKRFTKITMVVAIAVVLVLGLASVALASSWTDVPDSMLAAYGVTNVQVAGISSGYVDGTFKPAQDISRAQFTKMADAAFTVALANPAMPTFSDVPATNYYYQYIEAAHTAGLVNGLTASTFGPNASITREQAIAIIARAVAAEQGYDLTSMTTAQVNAALAPFGDQASVSTSLRAAVAYAVVNGITKGNSAGNLAPQSAVTRIVGATLLVRSATVTPVTPTVTALSPTGGSYLGGTSVTITGTSLTTAKSVMFGTVAATSYTVNSDTSITAVAPAGTSGTTVDVTVTNAIGTSAVVTADQFMYGVVPTVSSLSPASGGPGAIVTVYGAGFTGATSVTFGGVAASSFIMVSDSQITAVAPTSLSNTTVDVQVGNAVGMSALSSADLFYFYSVPVISALSPAGGPMGGGNTVILTGSGFTSATQVLFGSVNASFIIESDTTIAAVAPMGSGQVYVTVANTYGTTADEAANLYTYGSPVVSALSPAAGPASGGTVVTINGSGFSGATAVSFGGVSANTFIVSSDTQITAVAPVGSVGAVVEVVVTTPAGQSTPAAANADLYTYNYSGVPTVTSLNPSTGAPAGGTSVTISGTGFVGVTGVTWGSISMTADATLPTLAGHYYVVSSTVIDAIAPLGAVGTNVYVTVTNGSGTSAGTSGSLYGYYGAPTVASLSPGSGTYVGGTNVYINGSNYSSTSAVSFVPSVATVTIAGAPGVGATATATVVHGVVTGLTITNGGSGYVAPTVTIGGAGVGATATATMSGGVITGLTITNGGTGYYGAPVAAMSYVVLSNTQILAVAPLGVQGSSDDVLVTNAVGISAYNAGDYYYYY